MIDYKKTIERLKKHPVITMDKQNVTADAAILLQQYRGELQDWRDGVNAFQDCKDLVKDFDRLKTEHNLLVKVSTGLQSRVDELEPESERYIALAEKYLKQKAKIEELEKQLRESKGIK